MVDAARILWIHRGRRGGQLLRLHTPAAGELVLSRQAGYSGLVLAKVDGAGVHDLRLDLATMLGGTEDPYGIWHLGFQSGQRVVQVVGADAVEGGLGTTRVRINSRPYTLRVAASPQKDCKLRVGPSKPWAEVLQASVDDNRLTVICVLPLGIDPPSEAIWKPRGSDARDAPAYRVPVTGDDRECTFLSDPEFMPLPGARSHWDVSLACGEELVRVGSHLDDVVDKRRAVVLPQMCHTQGGHSYRATPYYNRFNNLAMVIEQEGSDARTAGSLAAPGRRSGDVVRAATSSSAPAAGAPRRDVGPVGRLVLRLARWVFARLEQDVAAGPSPVQADRDGPVHLLLAHAYGVGGTVRTTTNLASALAERREVHLVSVYRLHEEGYFDVVPGVRRRTLVDHPWLHSRPRRDPRTWLRRRALQLPSVLLPARDGLGHHFSLLSDVQLVRWLRSIRDGTIVATRPGLSHVVARFARPGVLLVGQQHYAVSEQSEDVWEEVRHSYRRLHGMTALTHADADALRERLAGTATRVTRLPNALTYADPPRSGLVDPVVIAAGKYTRSKGIDALLAAFAAATTAHPDWQLRVYGRARRDDLEAARALARDLGVAGRVLFMPPTPRLEVEMGKASLCVSASRFEAFGMTIVEAMSCGLPVVAFDCPHGPRELITEGVDGRLIPLDDIGSLTSAIRRLVEDGAERHRLGEAARDTARRYFPTEVAPMFDAFLKEVRSSANDRLPQASTSNGHPR